MTGGSDVFFGLKIYTLGIFWVKRSVMYLFLQFISERTFRFKVSLSVNVEQKGGRRDINGHTNLISLLMQKSCIRKFCLFE